MIGVWDNFPYSVADRVVALACHYKDLNYGYGSFIGYEIVKSDRHGYLRMMAQAEYLRTLVPWPTLGPVRAGYRPYLARDRQPTFIHTDFKVGTHTGILFLSEDPAFGLSFWRHRLTGLQDIRMELDPEMALAIDQDGFIECLWDKIAHVPSKLGRFVLFPAGYFHSRWPEKAATNELEKCRLVKVFFFN